MTTNQERSTRAAPFVFRRRTWVRILAFVVVVLALAYVGMVLDLPVDHDEVEHAHAAFRMLNGQVPYRDFYQNHLPAYGLLGMRLLRLFPFSVTSILAGRAINLLALVGCWLLGLRLLKSIRGGLTCLGMSVYSLAVVTMACETYFHTTRPDPLMAFFATAGICLIPLRGAIASARALWLGLLFGLSIAVSPRAVAMAGVVPVLVVVICVRERRLRPAAALGAYGLGMGLGLLPTAWWVFRNGLFEAFRFDVLGLNSALSKPWYLSFTYLLIPILFVSILGALAQPDTGNRRSNRSSNAPPVMALAMAAGIALAVLSRHDNPYNLQVLIIPIAIGFTAVLLRLCLRIRALAYQVLLCAALIGYPVIHAGATLVRLDHETRAIPLRDLQALMDFARPGGRTCTAFSPAHPVFCRDVSGLSNGWDVFFVENIRDARQLERFRGLWRDGVEQTIAQRPDIILRRSPDNCWERAVNAGLIEPEDVERLDALRPLYLVRRLGPREVWIRRSR